MCRFKKDIFQYLRVLNELYENVLSSFLSHPRDDTRSIIQYLSFVILLAHDYMNHLNTTRQIWPMKRQKE